MPKKTGDFNSVKTEITVEVQRANASHVSKSNRVPLSRAASRPIIDRKMASTEHSDPPQQVTCVQQTNYPSAGTAKTSPR